MANLLARWRDAERMAESAAVAAEAAIRASAAAERAALAAERIALSVVEALEALSGAADTAGLGANELRQTALEAAAESALASAEAHAAQVAADRAGDRLEGAERDTAAGRAGEPDQL